MSLLTLSDLIAAYKTVSPDKEWALGGLEDANKFANAIEAAVIKKLATVSVEPVAWHDEEFDMAYTASELAGEPSDPTMFPPLFTTSAIAAARVQALEEAAKRMEGPNNNYGAVIRALIGCKDD